VETAVQQFVTNPAAANIGVGIQFFGQSGNNNATLDCDVSRYATPVVPIGLASVVGQDVANAVVNTYPGGLTPTLPALQGAIQYAESHQSATPNRATVVVLVTDGYPTQCQSPVSVTEISNAAAAGAANGIRTYVVGLAAGFNLDSIAQAGGTNTAFLLDEGDITQTFLNTLLNISNNPISCEYEIPLPPDPSQQIDYTKVSIVYTPSTGTAQEIPHADTLSDCSRSTAGGWYYDYNAAPTRILLCPCSCSAIAAGTVQVRLGCTPRPIDIQ
jgi:hypothetical protein